MASALPFKYARLIPPLIILGRINALFPYHGRFAFAYNVDLGIPVSQLHGQEIKITITGPLGVKTVQLPATATTL